jgi:3',5'-cyclic AMP phosphodiesterase CpdA
LKIAHATDIHWFQQPGISELTYKRLLGTANLVLRGRKAHFDVAAQTALVDHLCNQQPDLVIISGDLTAQALESEFATAREALEPVLKQFPTFMVPGNHDRYTTRSQTDRVMERHFSDWMHLNDSGIGRLDLGDVTVLGLDPNRPTWFNATGVIPQRQLEALEHELAQESLRDRFIVLVIHYPVLGPSGSIYDNWHHGLLNAQALVDLLKGAPAQPKLIVHGHKHHGYTVPLHLSDDQRPIPIFNCGSSGYARTPDGKRAGATNVYTIENGSLIDTERFIYDGERFTAEAGGLYQSGF